MSSASFPDCAEGLHCEESTGNGMVFIPGSESSCVRVEVAHEGETCGGWDEMSSASFPDCAEGLECKESTGNGMVFIPGSESFCVASATVGQDRERPLRGPQEYKQ